jgi:hypothetical protein
LAFKALKTILRILITILRRRTLVAPLHAALHGGGSATCHVRRAPPASLPETASKYAHFQRNNAVRNLVKNIRNLALFEARGGRYYQRNPK